MGLFGSFKPDNTFPWNELHSLEDLEKALQEETEELKVFFKHSTRCSISTMALRDFQQSWNKEMSGFRLYFLDLLAHRDVSNALADKTDITHQSPQVIVLKGNEVVYTASHEQISAPKIQRIA
jgi:bacillithiol system protein YtxJ